VGSPVAGRLVNGRLTENSTATSTGSCSPRPCKNACKHFELDDDGAPYRAGLARALFVDDAGGSPGGKRTHLVDLMESAAACKAVYAGSIPTPASTTVYLGSHQWAVAQTHVDVARRTRPRGARIACSHLYL
jgi:hypothetical protein